MRIGIGVLRKPAEASFQRFGRYEIVDPGTWQTRTGKDRIEFVHTLKDGTGYAYTYRKTLRLSGESLVIEHELKNTGTKPIVTTVYNHNFFTLDGKTTGPDNVVRFPFAAEGGASAQRHGEVRGRELAIARAFQPKENIFTELEGFGPRRLRLRVRDGEPRHRRRRPRRGRSAAGEAGVLVGLQDGVPGAVHRRQRRARAHHSWRLTYTFYEAKAGAPATR